MDLPERVDTPEDCELPDALDTVDSAGEGGRRVKGLRNDFNDETTLRLLGVLSGVDDAVVGVRRIFSGVIGRVFRLRSRKSNRAREG